MLLPLRSRARPPRLTVLAYDMASQRRARRVRRLLESVHHAKQYSVFEASLHPGELRELLAELTSLCDLSQDLLAAWWPRADMRIHWDRGRFVVTIAGMQEDSGMAPLAAMRDAGNFVVCYDISDPEALTRVAGAVAVEASMVQRSVYWLRSSADRIQALLERCAGHIDEDDRLWAYPLRRSADLWRIGATETAVLPIAEHRWPGGKG